MVKVENLYCQFFYVAPNRFWRIFSMLLKKSKKAIQQLNGLEKNSVAITLMLNHNLTGLLRPLGRNDRSKNVFEECPVCAI